ncbi:HET-domain-containing protein, partial [Paraphaeosphaeria sporulosa]
PRRLLTVDTQSNGTTLIELDTNHGPITYACLSHSWGSHQPLTTTTATLQQRKDRIEWHELPKTFQEALYLCNQLGIAYLWIDSLCIIQDDADDWTYEASKMAEVYSNSYITIAASASRNDTEGCFRSVYRIIEGKWTMAGSWPLMQRAWAFQERLLSPRVLHLGPSELVWECQEHTRCECSEKDSQFDSPHLIRKSEWCNGLRHHSQKTASELWQKIVKEYSCRRLTFQRDVFPALSGIAKQLHQSFEGTSENPGTYLAGLWRNDLMQQLMWFTTTANCVSKPVGLRELPAPSWSWAAAEG